ncbi:helix-turn-helix domain-containing protein [Paenibacillus sp. S3N08]|uniref:Helix-turn-helix domain-containing protein n=1 Tax=Paenibacillus agricola TaxID=2716264 RepID=A0ABX0JDN4_9BACL|nr:helix-turn-helix domain-containing protein [Paenibacillus agricola]
MDRKSRSKILTWNALPEVLTAQHIADYLYLSRRRVYELFQITEAAGGIANFAIGGSKRVDREDFKRWVDARKKEKAQRINV